jgi:hypothetical protein
MLDILHRDLSLSGALTHHYGSLILWQYRMKPVPYLERCSHLRATFYGIQNSTQIAQI